MSDDRLRRAYAEELKQSYLKTGFKQGFEAGYAKAKEDFEKKGESVCDTCKNIGYCEPCEKMKEGEQSDRETSKDS